jgi:hypothetical protein
MGEVWKGEEDRSTLFVHPRHVRVLSTGSVPFLCSRNDAKLALSVARRAKIDAAQVQKFGMPS